MYMHASGTLIHLCLSACVARLYSSTRVQQYVNLPPEWCFWQRYARDILASLSQLYVEIFCVRWSEDSVGGH